MSPASLHTFPTCSTLAVLVALAGCGNRGELYLEPSVDTAVEAEIRRLGTEPLEGGPGDARLPAPDPTVTPEPGAGDVPTAVPGDAPADAPDAPDAPDDADDDDGSDGKGASEGAGDDRGGAAGS